MPPFRLSGVQFFCQIKAPMSQLTNAVVSLFHTAQVKQNAAPSSCMKLRQNFRDPLKYNFTVCLGGAMRGSFSTEWLVQWIEMNVILGAQKIMMYNYSISHDMDPYLAYYQKSGLLEILPWHIPFNSTSLRKHIQKGVLSDCFLRMRHHTRYIVQNDVDELIVPRHADDKTWSDMIHRSGCDPNARGYSARHLLYAMDYPGNVKSRNDSKVNVLDKSDYNINAYLLTQGIIQRSALVLNHPGRCKYIANTFVADDMMTHKTGMKGPHNQECIMDINVGANHHYRRQAMMPVRKGLVVDPVMHKYKDALTERVKLVYPKLFG